jgi:hypothetical protein
VKCVVRAGCRVGALAQITNKLNVGLSHRRPLYNSLNADHLNVTSSSHLGGFDFVDFFALLDF